MKTILLSLLVAIIGFGCAATSHVARYDQIQRPPTTGEVEVFSSAQNIKRPYKEIALITAEEGWDDGEAKLTQLMIAKARQLGADAIILLGARKDSAGGVVVGYTYVAAEYNNTRCSAIVFTDK